jgi:hypothetical protein
MAGRSTPTPAAKAHRLVACYLNAYPQPPVVTPRGRSGTPAVGVPGSIEHPLLCPPAS